MKNQTERVEYLCFLVPHSGTQVSKLRRNMRAFPNNFIHFWMVQSSQLSLCLSIESISICLYPGNLGLTHIYFL